MTVLTVSITCTINLHGPQQTNCQPQNLLASFVYNSSTAVTFILLKQFPDPVAIQSFHANGEWNANLKKKKDKCSYHMNIYCKCLCQPSTADMLKKGRWRVVILPCSLKFHVWHEFKTVMR